MRGCRRHNFDLGGTHTIKGEYSLLNLMIIEGYSLISAYFVILDVAKSISTS